MCCATSWDVPVELPIYRALTEALSARRFRHDRPFLTVPVPPDGAAAVLRRGASGACVFFEHETHLCAIHRDLGAAVLPSTCRLFPRIALRDSRGTFITLSHFCPTAASMLLRDGVPLRIVENPAAFPDSDYEGLDAADAWPPLLQPRMLMERESYGAWEVHAIGRLADDRLTAESAVATLARDVEVLRTWRPGGRSLRDTIALLPSDVVHVAPASDLMGDRSLLAEVVACVPTELRRELDAEGIDDAYASFVRPVWGVFAAPVRRYVATKAFANWCAYQGKGLRTIVRGLTSAIAVLRFECARQCRDAQRTLSSGLLVEAIRASDWLLNHLASREPLAATWSRAEHGRVHRKTNIHRFAR